MCMLQIRALLYVGALSNGILEALAHAERAVTDAIVTPVPHPRCTGSASACSAGHDKLPPEHRSLPRSTQGRVSQKITPADLPMQNAWAGTTHAQGQEISERMRAGAPAAAAAAKGAAPPATRPAPANGAGVQEREGRTGAPASAEPAMCRGRRCCAGGCRPCGGRS